MAEAVARYRSASEAGDIDGMMAMLTPDAELVSPLSGRMVFRGTDDVRLLLTAVYRGVLRELRWSDEFGDETRRVMVGHAKVGPFKLGDAMVFELAPDGRIARIRPHLRPWLALTLFALMLGPKMGRHPGVLARALRG